MNSHRGRHPKFSDRHVAIVRAIDVNIGTRVVATLLGVDQRLIRRIRNHTSPYNRPCPSVDDSQEVDAALKRHFPAATTKIDS